METFSLLGINNFKKSIFFSWVMLALGAGIYWGFLLLAKMDGLNPVWQALFQVFGLLFLVTGILISFGGVHRINLISSDVLTMREIFSIMLRKYFSYFRYCFIVMLAVFVLVFLQMAIADLGRISYIGPYLVAIFSLLFFCLSLAIFIFVLIFSFTTPLFLGEGDNLYLALKRAWSVIHHNFVQYIILAVVLSALITVLIFALGKFSGLVVALTKRTQWSMSFAYPDFINKMLVNWPFSDLVATIPQPESSMKDLLKKHSLHDILNYVDAVKTVVSISYFLLFSFVISFPLVVIATINSNFFNLVKNKNKVVKNEN